MKKVLWVDTETTDLDPIRGGIIQIAGIIEIDGEAVEEFNFNIAPFPGDIISPKALEVNKHTTTEISAYPAPLQQKAALETVLSKYRDKFDKNGEKFFLGGKNVRFDLDFIASWFNKCGDKYLGSWINWRTLDPQPIVYIANYQGKLDLPNFKLTTLCEHFGVKLEAAHDALADIRATRELFNIVVKEYLK
jgi:DNA polymerase-3 subunit epsilon